MLKELRSRILCVRLAHVSVPCRINDVFPYKSNSLQITARLILGRGAGTLPLKRRINIAYYLSISHRCDRPATCWLAPNRINYLTVAEGYEADDTLHAQEDIAERPTQPNQRDQHQAAVLGGRRRTRDDVETNLP